MKIFTKNTQFYENLGMGMGIDTQFLGFFQNANFISI